MSPHVTYKSRRSILNFTNFVTLLSLSTCSIGHFCSTTRFVASGAQRMMASPGAIVNVFPIFHRCALLQLKKNALFVQKTYCLTPSYVHEDTETLCHHDTAKSTTLLCPFYLPFWSDSHQNLMAFG